MGDGDGAAEHVGELLRGLGAAHVRRDDAEVLRGRGPSGGSRTRRAGAPSAGSRACRRSPGSCSCGGRG
ncbi:hypothetical protein EVA_12039 [gut metagenome]|uniref:Uncharacterized protein n=1 Tax=gut metagenome TaxID=749906 RepID=J9GJR6_9ZZZZ